MKAPVPVHARWSVFSPAHQGKGRAYACLAWRVVLVVFVCLSPGPASAQDLPPALYPYLPLSVNPALASTPTQLEAGLFHRRAVGGGAATHAGLASPLMFGGGHWGGIGFQYTDERTGEPLGLRRQRLAGALAYSLKLSARQSLSLGFAGAFQSRRLATPPWSSRVADPRSSAANQPYRQGRSSFDLSWGFLYRGTDRVGQERFYLGLSLAPNAQARERSGRERTLPSLLVSGGHRLWSNDRLAVMPQVLWAYRQTEQWASMGGKLVYALERPGTVPGRMPKQLEVGAYYRTDRSVVLSLSHQGAAYGLAISYATPSTHTSELGNKWGGPEIALRLFPEQLVSGLRNGEAKERLRQKAPTKEEPNPRAPENPPVAPPPSVVALPPVPVSPEGQEAMEVEPNPAPQNPENTPGKISINFRSDHPRVVPPGQTLYFDSDQTEISVGDASGLANVVAVLQAHPYLTVRVIGHTDASGPADVNIRLSFRRAQQIADYLLDHGISGERVVVEGRGPFNPRVLNTSPQNRALNRRVEILYQAESTEEPATE